MRLDRTHIGAVVLAVGVVAGRAHAGTVTLRAADLLRRDVVVRDITAHRERPVRYVYGRAIRLGPLLGAVGAIRSARALARLDAVMLTETRALYRAPYRISAQKLAQARASASEAQAALASAVGALRARYGAEFAAKLLSEPRLVGRIGAGGVSVVEAMVPYPVLEHPPGSATARIEGGANLRGRTVQLQFLGVGGRVPSGMIGQALYYFGPALQAGTMLRIGLRLGTRPTRILRLPVSALIFAGRKAIAFRRIEPHRFRSFAVSQARPFYSDGHIAGYQSVWRGSARVPIVVKGAGLLWSLLDSAVGKR